MAGGIDWFRWHHGSVTDPKFQLVARNAGCSLPDVLAIWAYLLESASSAQFRGCFGEVDCEAVDCLFGFEDGLTAAVMQHMANRHLIADDFIVAWEKRQPKREDGTASGRKRRQREREHELKLAGISDTSANRDKAYVTTLSRIVTHGHDREEESRQRSKHLCASDDACDGFDEFWQAYPRKIAKASALKSWRKIRPNAELSETVMDALAKQKDSDAWKRDGGKFIPHPATWLNGRRWEDEIDDGGGPSADFLAQFEGIG